MRVEQQRWLEVEVEQQAEQLRWLEVEVERLVDLEAIVRDLAATLGRPHPGGLEEYMDGT